MYKSFGFSTLEVLLVDIPRSGKSMPSNGDRSAALTLRISGVAYHLPHRCPLYSQSAESTYVRHGCSMCHSIRRLASHVAAPEHTGIQMDEMGHVPHHSALCTRLVSCLDTHSFHVACRTKKTIIPCSHLPRLLRWVRLQLRPAFVRPLAHADITGNNMRGSQIFRERDAPRYVPGTVGACICLGLEFTLIVSWRLYYLWQNKRRDKKAAESGVSKEEQEREDRAMGEANMTDLQNPHFRYTM